MHGMSVDAELIYWRDQARHWQAKALEDRDNARWADETRRKVCEALIAERDTARHDLHNERQVVADLREQVALVRRHIDEIEHDVLITTQYRKARDSGGQHVGTGGRLGGAMPSTLVYLERLVRDLKNALDGGGKP